MAVTKTQRFEVFKRDKFICQYCGKRPPDTVLECDHIEPVCNGGSDDFHNLVTSCFDCNRGKAGRSLEDDATLPIQEMQLETLAQLTAFNEMLIDSMKTKDEQLKWLARRVSKNLDVSFSKQGDEHKSLSIFARTLDFDSIVMASETAGSKQISSPAKRWKYFCGICWKMIKSPGGTQGNG